MCIAASRFSTWRPGTASIVGREGLVERVRELQAIDTLEAMKTSEVYTDALKNSASGPVDTAKNLVKEPGKTLANIGRGLGGFFADVGYSIVSDDPSQENAAKTALGFAAIKRELAFKLGVNPYSSSQPLQDELSSVAWTSVGGGLTITAAFKAVGGAAGTTLSVGKTADGMRALVRDNSPRKLEQINFDMLESMGVSEALAEALLENYSYDPETRTRLIGALASMEGVAGRERFVERAALQDQPYNARIMREWAELFAEYHANVEQASRIVIAATAPLLVIGDKQAVNIVPADYVTSAPTVLAISHEIVAALRTAVLEPARLYASGNFDAAFSQRLIESGWGTVRGDIDLLCAGQEGN